MLRFDCAKKQGFVMQNNNIKNKNQTFGMNPIFNSRVKTSSTFAPVALDVVELTRQTSNIPKASQIHTANQAQIEAPIKVIIEKSEIESSSNDTTSLSENEIENNEFYEKDKQADKYFNNCCNTFSKGLSIIPGIGLFGAIENTSLTNRNKELDEIYGVPEYIPIKSKDNTVYWMFTAILQGSIIGGIVGIPMAIGGLFLNKKAQKELKKGYHEAYKKEQEQVKNETPYQTRLRHAKLKKEYYRKVADDRYQEYLRQQREAARRHRNNNYHRSYNRPTNRHTGGGR